MANSDKVATEKALKLSELAKKVTSYHEQHPKVVSSSIASAGGDSGQKHDVSSDCPYLIKTVTMQETAMVGSKTSSKNRTKNKLQAEDLNEHKTLDNQMQSYSIQNYYEEVN